MPQYHFARYHILSLIQYLSWFFFLFRPFPMRSLLGSFDSVMDASEFENVLAAFADALPRQLDDQQRQRIVGACDRIKEQLETPLETTGRLMLGVGFTSHSVHAGC